MPRILMLLVILAMIPGTLRAGGCEKDTDCKGDRICSEEAKCIDPDTPASAAGTSEVSEAPPLLAPRYRVKTVLNADVVELSRFRIGDDSSTKSWAQTRLVLEEYEVARATLRKGSSSRDASIGFGVACALTSAVGSILIVRVSNLPTGGRLRWTPVGLGLVGAGMVLGLAVSLPLGAHARGAPDRAIERYNRALDRGDFIPTQLLRRQSRERMLRDR